MDIRDAAGFVPGLPGAGVPDHVAFRAPDAAALPAMRRALGAAAEPGAIHDRRYFRSLYLRGPGGALMEYATDGPGFAVDETLEALGRTLMLPTEEAARAPDLEAMLPQLAMPGGPRLPARELPFIHRLRRPEGPDGSALVLLHGSGGHEADLMPLARRLAPRATLIGVRGRSVEEGALRWFRRLEAGRFDQADIAAEARAFAALVEGAVSGYGLDPARLTFLGWSNGANLLAAVLQLHPGVVRRTILLRATQPLEDPPGADLSGARALMLSGAQDPLAPAAQALARALREGGAELEARTLPAGHDLTAQETAIAREWLSA